MLALMFGLPRAVGAGLQLNMPPFQTAVCHYGYVDGCQVIITLDAVTPMAVVYLYHIYHFI